MTVSSERSASADAKVSAAALMFATAGHCAGSPVGCCRPIACCCASIVGLVSLGLSAVLARWCWQQTVGRQRVARSYLARLAEQGRNWPSSGTPDPPPLDPRSPWIETLAGVRELLAIAAGRLTEAEHARSVLELLRGALPLKPSVCSEWWHRCPKR